jgi:hypothetical protein
VGGSVDDAKEYARRMGRMPREGVTYTGMGDTNPYSRQFSRNRSEEQVVEEMRLNRRVASRRTATAGGTTGIPGGGMAGNNVSFATGRPRDPMFYWRQSNIPYDVTKDDELKKIREFCNTPEAPIWMGDYSFKPISEVQSGDEVIGWQYNTGPSGGQRKKLVRTKVLAVKRRVAPQVVRITMESGKVIRCTPDHQWANYSYSPTQREVLDRRIMKATGQPRNKPIAWKQPEYRAAQVGGYLTSFIEPTPELTDDKQRMAAMWLAGLYDGEGCGNELGQSATHNPAVCQRIKDSLETLGLPWTQQPNAIYIREAGQGYRWGAHQDMVNFLNWTEPTRKTTKQNDAAILVRPSGGKDRVVSIESEGPGEVVSMQTETGNYVAWGYASKNCRLLYLTHPVIAACTDIFTKFPLQGMELECKDDQLKDFYETLFFDQLDYPNYLKDLGREYWLVGEAWPLGSFNEILGVWEDEELLNPDDVQVERSPFLRDPRFLIKLPETLRRVLQQRSPAWEYDKLMRAYPELAAYAGDDALMPVSNILLKQLRFKGDTFHKRGIPILMRGFRAIVQEEMLNTALDAIADRLYTPLILAKLGASATDLGTDMPWVPTQLDLENFEEAVDAALAGDFRVITHHFATDMAPVFGRENMPDLSADFDRVLDRILMVYGISRTMLNGAEQGETYAADALNRDMVSQTLADYQALIKDFFRDRALVVAEAQEHFDYDVRGGKRYVKMEEVIVPDEETGEEKIIEQPALLVPELTFKTMTLADQQEERQFMEALNQAGVPVPYTRRLTGTGLDFDDIIEQRQSEQVALAVAEQETRRETFKALRDAGLPIPADLAQDFQPKSIPAGQPAMPEALPGQDAAIPTLGALPPDLPALAPSMEDQQQTDEEDASGPPGAANPLGQVIMMPNANMPQPGDQRPPESDEQRGRMPKPAKRKDELDPYDQFRARHFGQVKQAAREYFTAPDNSEEVSPSQYYPSGRFGDPRHIGMRAYVDVPEEYRVPDEDAS